MTTQAELLEQLNWRYATKAFDPSKKIAPDLWNTLEQSLLLSPSASGLQLWKFYSVTDKAVREKLKAVTPAGNHPKLDNASHLIVIAAKAKPEEADADRLIERVIQVRGVDRASTEGQRKSLVGLLNKTAPDYDFKAWAAKQTYIPLGFFLTSCALLKVDACPMEGFDEKGYDKVLGIDEAGYFSTAIVAAGYRATDDKYSSMKKVRFEKSEVIVEL